MWVENISKDLHTELAPLLLVQLAEDRRHRRRGIGRRSWCRGSRVAEEPRRAAWGVAGTTMTESGARFVGSGLAGYSWWAAGGVGVVGDVTAGGGFGRTTSWFVRFCIKGRNGSIFRSINLILSFGDSIKCGIWTGSIGNVKFRTVEEGLWGTGWIIEVVWGIIFAVRLPLAIRVCVHCVRWITGLGGIKAAIGGNGQGCLIQSMGEGFSEGVAWDGIASGFRNIALLRPSTHFYSWNIRGWADLFLNLI